MVRYPPPLVLSFTQAHLCDTPFFATYRASFCAIPHKNKSTKEFCDTLSLHKSRVRFAKYRYWASKHPWTNTSVGGNFRKLSGLMLGRDCFRALFRKQFPPPLNWLKSGFSRKSRNGFEVGAKVGLDPFLRTFAPKNPLLTHFWTHSSLLTKTHLKPTLSGNKLFSKKGP